MILREDLRFERGMRSVVATISLALSRKQHEPHYSKVTRQLHTVTHRRLQNGCDDMLARAQEFHHHSYRSAKNPA